MALSPSQAIMIGQGRQALAGGGDPMKVAQMMQQAGIPPMFIAQTTGVNMPQQRAAQAPIAAQPAQAAPTPPMAPAPSTAALPPSGASMPPQAPQAPQAGAGMGLDPATMRVIMQLGGYQGELEDLGTEEAQAYAMVNADNPQMRGRGTRVSTAANPMEFIGKALREYKGRKDLKDIQARREGIRAQQEAARTAYGEGALGQGTPVTPQSNYALEAEKARRLRNAPINL